MFNPALGLLYFNKDMYVGTPPTKITKSYRSLEQLKGESQRGPGNPSEKAFSCTMSKSSPATDQTTTADSYCYRLTSLVMMLCRQTNFWTDSVSGSQFAVVNFWSLPRCKFLNITDRIPLATNCTNYKAYVAYAPRRM
jgi:hypothetical protein